MPRHDGGAGPDKPGAANHTNRHRDASAGERSNACTRQPVSPAPEQLAARLADLNPALLAAAVALLPARVLVAVMAGVDVGFARLGQALAEDWPDGRWHRPNPVLASELLRHRWPPHGDRAEWIEWGPAGAPCSSSPRREGAA